MGEKKAVRTGLAHMELEGWHEGAEGGAGGEGSKKGMREEQPLASRLGQQKLSSTEEVRRGRGNILEATQAVTIWDTLHAASGPVWASALGIWQPALCSLAGGLL